MNKYEKELEDIKSIILPIELLHLQELVERATPKKVKQAKDMLYECPVCKNYTPPLSNTNYCINCGQALDWGKE